MELYNGNDVMLRIIGVITLIVGLISFFFNGLILYLYNRAFTNKRNRLVNANLVSLTLSSLGLCFQFPFMMISSFRGGWVFGWEACELSAFTAGFFAYAQIYTLASIAIERAWATKTTRVQTPTTIITFLKISIVWIISLVLSLCPYFGFGSFMIDALGISCTFDYVDTSEENIFYVITITICGFLVPLTIIIVCYIVMIQLVRVSNADMRLHLRNSYTRKNKAALRMREYGLAKTAGKSVMAFVIGWSPYACLALLSLTGKHIPEIVQSLAALFAKSQTSLNAAFYVLSHPKFRRQISKFSVQPDQTTVVRNVSRLGVQTASTSRNDTKRAVLNIKSQSNEDFLEEN